MSASPQAIVVAFLVASVLLIAGLARTSAATADARWTVVTTGMASLACASLAAWLATIGW